MPAWLFGVRLTVIISEKWKFATLGSRWNNTSFKLAAFQHLCKVSPNATVMVFVPAYYNIEGAMETSLPNTHDIQYEPLATLASGDRATLMRHKWRARFEHC